MMVGQNGGRLRFTSPSPWPSPSRGEGVRNGDSPSHQPSPTMVHLSAVILVFVMTATSCAPVKSSKERYQEIVSSWIGAHKDQMIAQFGPPLRESKLSDGSTVMVWEDTTRRYREGYENNPGQYYYITLQKIFTADSSGIIRDGSIKLR